MNLRPLPLLPLLALGLAGCLRNVAPTHFYLLKPISEAARPAPAGTAEGPSLGLGPIRIPAYLDRPQIVTAVSGAEYKLADEHRWAERLDETITRVLGQNLAALIPTDRVFFHPWALSQKPDVQVGVTVQEFHADAAGQVRLAALWTLKTGDEPAGHHRFTCVRPATAGDYHQIAEVQSLCLEQLSRAIAGAVRGGGEW
jgi:uncharacterized lipoprotein YmbA